MDDEAKETRVTKTEIVELHGLLYCARHALEAAGLAKPAAWSDYDALGVRPLHLYKPRHAHLAAVRLLIEGLRRAVRPDSHLKPRL